MKLIQGVIIKTVWQIRVLRFCGKLFSLTNRFLIAKHPDDPVYRFHIHEYLSSSALCVGAFDSDDRFGHSSPGFESGLSLSR